MTTKEITECVNKYGRVGSTDKERYIDLPCGIKTKTKTAEQLIAFNDGKRPLALYWLDDYDEGYFTEYAKMGNEIKNKVEKYLIKNFK